MTLVSFAQAHEQIQVLLQYSFSDTDYLEEALYACPGYVRRTVLLDSNKRLAMVGDSAVDLVVNEMSYREGLSKGLCTRALFSQLAYGKSILIFSQEKAVRVDRSCFATHSWPRSVSKRAWVSLSGSAAVL